jgi:hypothetical protein
VTSKVDHNAIKFTQLAIALVALVSFVGDWANVAGVLAVILGVGAIRPSWGLFRNIYRRVALPLRLLEPNLLDDDPAPHRFAQGMGAAVLLAGYAGLGAGGAALGWGLVLLVAVLALVNVVFDFCAGCFIFYQLRRAGLIRQASEGTGGR